jgi:competence protein ComEA
MIRTVILALAAAALLPGPLAAGAAHGSPQAAQAKPAQTPAPQPLLNLNTATKADLEKLPGIGPSMAQRILDYREKNGAFKKIEELMNIQGIGEKSFLKLRTLVTVVPPKLAAR